MSKSIAQDKRIMASIKIQNFYRCRLARRLAQDLFLMRYRQISLDHTSKYVFQDKKSLRIVRRLPKFFRKNEYVNFYVQKYIAPEQYNNGLEATGDNYAILLTNNQYTIGRWPKMDESLKTALNSDHDGIKSALSSEIFGKIRPVNIVSLKNPTTFEYLTKLKELRKVVRCTGNLIIYISAHFVHISGNKKSSSYLALRNSVWGNKNEIIETSIGLSTLIEEINKIKCKKTIFINYAFFQAPRKGLVSSSTKTLYPSPDLIFQLADQCNCPVFAPCGTGFTLKDYAKGNPGLPFIYKKNEKRINHNDEVERIMKLFKPDQSVQESVDNLELKKLENNDSMKKDEKSELKSTPSNSQLAKSQSKKIFPATTKNVIPFHSSSKGLYESTIWKKLIEEWNLSSYSYTSSINIENKPAKPAISWKKDPEQDNAFVIKIPTSYDKRIYFYKMTYWRLKNMALIPNDIIKKMYLFYKKSVVIVPTQVSEVNQGFTIFGRALIEAIKGGACTDDSETVTVSHLYSFIYKYMKNFMEEINNSNKKQILDRILAVNSVATYNYKRLSPTFSDENIDDKLTPDEIEYRQYKNSDQIPILYLGKGNLNLLTNEIFYRCGPPPVPDRPFILRVTDNEVYLQWYNPPFEGSKPLKYKILMRSVTRRFSNWNEIYYPGNITNTKFIVRNLPTGIPCQFKVVAYNNGGWSDDSLETPYVTPGEEGNFRPNTKAKSRSGGVENKNILIGSGIISEEQKWNRIQQSGIIGVLDILEDKTKNVLYNRRLQLNGLRILLGLCSTNIKSSYTYTSYSTSRGFKNNKIALRALQFCLSLLRTYKEDIDINYYCFMIIGWALAVPLRKIKENPTTDSTVIEKSKGKKKVEPVSFKDELLELREKTKKERNELVEFLLDEEFVDLAYQRANNFRFNSNLVNSYQWMSSGLLRDHLLKLKDYEVAPLFPSDINGNMKELVTGEDLDDEEEAEQEEDQNNDVSNEAQKKLILNLLNSE